MSRIKTVYTSDMVCHLWANRHGHDVRTASDNLYTRGAVLYSYGSHYAIGAFLDAPKSGGALIVWNDRGYSSTTAKHTSQAWRALAGWQRQNVVRVPALNAENVNKPEKLAAACVDAAKKPLESCEKARQNLTHHIANAERWFDSARALYTYAGNEKAAAAVPTFRGLNIDESKAAKAAAASILASIGRAEYLETAKNYVARAIGDLNAAQTRVHLYGLRDQENRQYPHGPQHSADTACGICRAAHDAVLNAEKAVSYFKRAAANVPPNVYRVKKQAAAIESEWQAAANAELNAERRQSLENEKRLLIRTLATYGRETDTYKTLATGNRIRVGTSRALHWRVERIIDNAPTMKDAPHLWADESERAAQMAEWSALVERCRRIIAAGSLHSSVESLADSCDKYASNDMRGGYSVPDSRHTRGAVNKWAAIIGADVPQYWQQKAAAAIERADTLARGHAERMAAINAEKIERWRNGENVSVPRDIPPMVRIVAQTVQTSWGASVPLDHAARLVRIAQRVAANGGGGRGERVGHFTVDHINADLSAVIGCHTFTADESRRAIALIQAATAEQTQGT